jgi:hypothetical protein
MDGERRTSCTFGDDRLHIRFNTVEMKIIECGCIVLVRPRGMHVGYMTAELTRSAISPTD